MLGWCNRKLYLTALALLGAMIISGCKPSTMQPAPHKPTRKTYTVYLTTDDGPLRGSQNINAVIRQEKVPMTAFVVGTHARSKITASYVKRYRENQYITLANHSYTHANSRYIYYYNHPSIVLSDFNRNKRYYRFPNNIVRLPGRNSWRLGPIRRDVDKTSRSAANLLTSNGYALYGWDLEWKRKRNGKFNVTAKQLYKEVLDRLKKERLMTKRHLILLMHDQMFWTKYAAGELQKFIRMLKANPSIRLAKLSEYPVPKTRTKTTS